MRSPIRRWTAARKAELLVAIRTGKLARADAMSVHQVSAEELDSWEARFARHGQAGLAVARAEER